VRSVRTEQILLVKAEGGVEKLASTDQVPAVVPSQRRFLVRSDGAYLGYEASRHELRIRDAGGREISVPGRTNSGDFRFTPDGKAVVCATEQRTKLEIVELASGARRTMANYLARITWLECSRDGVVMIDAPDYGQGQSIVFVPWSGKKRTLARADWFTRVVAGGGSTKLVYFQGKHAFALDSSETRGRPVRFASLDGEIKNAEMSRDGERLLAATKHGAWQLAIDGSRERLVDTRGIHTVWFSADGKESLVASGKRVIWRRATGTLTRELRAVAGARFARTRRGVVIAHGKQASLWKPDDTLEPLATHERPLFGADEFAGGIVIWTGRALPQSNEPRRIHPGAIGP
jgi:hypothetical protein